MSFRANSIVFVSMCMCAHMLSESENEMPWVRSISCLQSMMSMKSMMSMIMTPKFYKAFCGLLINPMFHMLSNFKLGPLPNTMMDANISLIFKKGRPADNYAPYRPTAALRLHVDRKWLSTILSTRLEGILPDLISVDETGSLLSRSSCNNIRRLLPGRQNSSKSKAKSLVICWQGEGLWRDWVASPVGFPR